MLPRRPTLVAIACALVGPALAGCVGQDSAEDLLVVGTEAAYPPFEDVDADGQIVGFDPDVMREVAERSGYRIRLTNMQFRAIIPSIVNGQIDAGISAFTITDERKNQVDFTIPYYENELLVAVRSDTTDLQEQEDLRGRRVCTQTGTTSETWLRENVGATDENLMLLNAFPPCAEALKRGDVDAMMIDRAVVRTLVDQSGGDLETAFTIPVDERFGIAVPKGRGELLNKFNEALREMREDGTLERLMDKWAV